MSIANQIQHLQFQRDANLDTLPPSLCKKKNIIHKKL